ncbi:hypothetical protein LPB90_10635 [Chryseobacterium sp. LC2016-29]|uniref:hypothetical protein n=1 Tax=Chryseobacterium sp. LC2016-29 TaxID=2897331 RepID=UPI001E284C77|nr:hypothetical protein [Chryseobacterium sp. LC2016-29]MCD0478916.1 hypothetical protein [Chryseobacterium sp. LC2016-29]
MQKDNLLFLIDKLPSQQTRYSYTITIQAVVIFISIVTGAFLPKFLDFAKDIQDFKARVSKSFDSSIDDCLYGNYGRCIYYKDLVQQYIRNKNRLIRTLHNIYLEEYV